jgi:hypothetical protein
MGVEIGLRGGQHDQESGCSIRGRVRRVAIASAVIRHAQRNVSHDEAAQAVAEFAGGRARPQDSARARLLSANAFSATIASPSPIIHIRRNPPPVVQ